MNDFQTKLNDALIADIRGGNKEGIVDAVLMIEIVKGKSLVNYNGDQDDKFAKITVSLYKFVPASRRLLLNSIIYDPLKSHVFEFFESNVDIETRFFWLKFAGFAQLIVNYSGLWSIPVYQGVFGLNCRPINGTSEPVLPHVPKCRGVKLSVTFRGRILSLMPRKENGVMWPSFGFIVLTLNVLVEKVSSILIFN